MRKSRAIFWIAGALGAMLLALVAVISPKAKTHLVLMVMDMFVFLLVLTGLLTATAIIFSTVRFLQRKVRN